MARDLDVMKPLLDCQLYAFIDTAYLNGRNPEEIARQLCHGGADLIQLRAKQSSPDEIKHLAKRILPILRNSGVGLVLNDHPDITAQIGADFVHLGQEDFFDSGHAHARELHGSSSTFGVGLSSHSPAQAIRAIAAGADYVAVGPVFATGTKPSAQPVTLEYVRWAATNITVPWFAIGGINLHNVDDVLAAGARRICVVSAILNAPDIALACRDFRRKLG